MSFQVPQNVPFLGSSQRPHEDTYWRQKKSNNGHAKGGAITSKINDIFGESQGLPMYKDKPHFPSSRRKSRGILQQKRVLALIGSAAVLILWWVGWLPWGSRQYYDPADHEHSFFHDEDWSEQREAVKEVFKTSWEGYEKYAWGLDEYNP